MKQGRLRVLLGAAPGVGKTYAMLEEGRRLRSEGRDVVVAVVETHGRAATRAMTLGFEIVPRLRVAHRGVDLEELDLDAVLARAPQVALVDELAHTNAPGLAHEKRWRDVETLLDAGIDVISTVNIQHIESLNDVVQQITGVPQRETVPDAVLRDADQIEVVDLAPQALRDRLSAGVVYPAARIDAALSNYFRLGNLTALRELALLWLADEVDSSLQRYRSEHGIGQKWEARERVVVALTGGPEGETLLRRGSRIAARSAGGQLLAVHVTSQDGLRSVDPGALTAQRALVESLGGTFHQVVGSDIPEALVQFARASNATQLVLGVSRRSRLAALVTGAGIGATVIRESGDIDVHIVTHAAAGGRLRMRLPGVGGSLTARRRLLGAAIALVGGPLLTWLLTAFRSEDSITSDVLAYQLLVVVVALVGGIWPALFAALLSGVTLDFFFVDPLYTVTVDEPLHLLALLLYIVIAVLVSIVVDQAARRSRAARRSAAESELIAGVAGEVLRGQDALQAFVTRTREAFGLTGVRVVVGERVLASDGEPVDGPGASDISVDRVAVGERAVLELHGRTLQSSDRRLLGIIVTQLASALENADLEQTAREMAPLAAADRVRTALLAAVGHDLRRPLASATAAVTGLRSSTGILSPTDREELFETAETSLGQLTRLLTDLLDVSRVQAGALAVTLADVDLADVVPAALEELEVGPSAVELDLPAELPAMRADPVLLERVLVNLLANALKHAPSESPVVVAASAFLDGVQIRVIDRGKGVPADRREDIFVPFQRLGDTDNSSGLGLGLALSKGFVEGMGGTLEYEETPGGGSTFVVALRVADGSPTCGGTVTACR
ncbi:sensor histidine kinase KdpD [Herbiconiux sp. VKM Ac-1786]|uniref:sensor histidine kinase n=1 Tax=Herbiconiux sp. VKM Ac-1786 TaxID=2783824 RepID=UPI00188A9719|nr:ATP-binding protein [Herbiconiux sp. VKM Ac-1786]MBF4571216.1 sensor histidine kinase KdpD [Herbiconiux sp. VKM Ac-1786]